LDGLEADDRTQRQPPLCLELGRDPKGTHASPCELFSSTITEMR